MSADGELTAVALYPYTAVEEGQLSFEKGDEFLIIDDDTEYENWWEVQHKRLQLTGLIPANYCARGDPDEDPAAAGSAAGLGGERRFGAAGGRGSGQVELTVFGLTPLLEGNDGEEEEQSAGYYSAAELEKRKREEEQEEVDDAHVLSVLEQDEDNEENALPPHPQLVSIASAAAPSFHNKLIRLDEEKIIEGLREEPVELRVFCAKLPKAGGPFSGKWVCPSALLFCKRGAADRWRCIAQTECLANARNPKFERKLKFVHSFNQPVPRYMLSVFNVSRDSLARKELRPEEIMGNVDFTVEEVLNRVVSFGMTHVNQHKQEKLKAATVHIEGAVSRVLCKGELLMRTAKQGELVAWYCECKVGKLLCAPSEAAYHRSGASRVILLKNATLDPDPRLSLKAKDRQYDGCLLELTTGGGEERGGKAQSYIMATRSEQALEQWVQALRLGIPDKLFGVPFEISLERSGGSPVALQRCVEWLNQHGLTEIGIYRVPGSTGVRDEIIRRFDCQAEVDFQHKETKATTSNLASVVVQFLSQSPSSLFGPPHLQASFEACAGLKSGAERAAGLAKLLNYLPRAQRFILYVLLDHLWKVNEKTEENEMPAHRIAYCLYKSNAQALQALIEEWQEIKGEQAFDEFRD